MRAPPPRNHLPGGSDVQFSPKHQMKTKKKKVFTLSDVQFSFKHQVKTNKRRPIFPPKSVLRHDMRAPHRATGHPFTCGAPRLGDLVSALRQVYLLCRWEGQLTGFPHLRVVDRWPATPKRARYGALIAFS